MFGVCVVVMVVVFFSVGVGRTVPEQKKKSLAIHINNEGICVFSCEIFSVHKNRVRAQ